MVLEIYLASYGGFCSIVWGLCLAGTMFALLLPNAAASLGGYWRDGRFPGMHMVLSLASQWLQSQSFVMPSASAWIKAVRGAGWRSYDSASCLEALLFGNGEGKWEKEMKDEWRDQIVKLRGGEVKSIGVPRCFLPSSHLVFCSSTCSFFLQTLVSDLIWSRLLTWLSIVNHHANVFQVFPL